MLKENKRRCLPPTSRHLLRSVRTALPSLPFLPPPSPPPRRTMSKATSSSSSSASSSSSTGSRKRRYTREQLETSRAILSKVTLPVLPYLPLSPPTSRDNSPNLSSKRRLESDSDEGQRKKARVTSSAAPSQSQLSSSNRQLEPSEDGEVNESSNPLALVSHYVPVRRPRRSAKLQLEHFDEVYNKYHAYGRMLKYSGELRLWSTYPPGSKDYQRLLTPPPVTSPYHKYGSLLARIELLDGLVNFVYAIWAKDCSRRGHFHSWNTVEGYLRFTKDKWIHEDCDEREKVLVGLVWMIEGYIHGREVTHSAGAIDQDNDRLIMRLKIFAAAEVARDAAAAEAASAANVASQKTPPMLPSPVSINAGNSANSTPTTKRETTPAPVPTANGNNQAKPRQEPDPMPPPHVTIPVNATFMYDRKTQSKGILGALQCFEHAQRFLTLPILAKHYPRTFARLVHTSLSATDELEPDFEDDECELFWPGQALTNRGLGWTCLMAKSLINEFSKRYGYRGIDGVIIKADGDNGVGDGSIPASTAPSERNRAADPDASVQR